MIATATPSSPAQVLGAGHVYFSRICKKPVRVKGGGRTLGKLTDLVFALEEPAPRPVGVYLDHGWGVPDEFIPWDSVVDLFESGVLVQPPPSGDRFPPFRDQPGWILVEKHLMGRTILDIDERKVEVVNDVVLQETEQGWRLTAVDTSFNGFLRKWRFPWLETLLKDELIPWRYVQPLSVEDAMATDHLQLSVAKAQLQDLPKEDLADALEELSGQEQEALFSALEPQVAADALTEAEPRAQRQLISALRKERAATILASLSTPQLVDLLSVLPHEEIQELLPLLPEPRRIRIEALLSEREVTAVDFMSQGFLTIGLQATVEEARRKVRGSGLDHGAVSYLYVEAEPGGPLVGVVDARMILVSAEGDTMESIMSGPVVGAERDDIREDLVAMFTKYHFRLIPVVDAEDRILGVVRYNDVMRSAAKG